MLQLRPAFGNPGQGAFFSPGRDLLHTFAPMLREALISLNVEDDDLKHYLQTYNLSDAELECVGKGLATFQFEMQTERDFEKCLEKSGLADCDPAAMGLVGSRMMFILLKQFHMGFGEAYIQGEQPPIPIEQYFKEFSQVMNSWRWLNPSPMGSFGNWLRRYLFKIKKNGYQFFMNLRSSKNQSENVGSNT
jgi:hypothetical protein